jgi:RimJ/RimL family protein N-acetyltransferase
MAEFRIETERLILRNWRDEDRAPFATMSADPQVMATLGPVMERDKSDALIDRLIAIAACLGHTFGALERREDGAFLGWCGLVDGTVPAIAGKPEIGWRLASAYWGQGYAREAAQATLAWGWANLDTDRIWAITSRGNSRSWGLMERLGMVRHPNLDFDHPNVPDDSALKPHITYSIGRDDPRPTR